jgi:hypothetical protein
MINERPCLPRRRNGTNRQAAVRRYQKFLGGPRTQDPMTSGMTAFMVAVGGTSLICYLLMNRVQNRKDRRQSAGGDTSGIGPGDSSGGDGWSLLSWFGSDSSLSDNSTSSSDSGGESGGGGGDGGGGGGD